MQPVLLSKSITKRKLLTGILLSIAGPAFVVMVTHHGIPSIIAGVVSSACFFTVVKVSPWK
jgi:hypothetical protein